MHGTGATVEENWSWNYQPALNALGIPWCAVQSPERGQGDIQVNGEYVVYAIREMYRRAGRRISVIGHSQGGMLPRWPLRFWPDTRAMVDDQIGFAPSNHGTTQARFVCGPCAPADWQQMDGSNFIQALNSHQETFAGVSYTEIYTRLDEIVRPPEGAELHTGDGRITNVAIQDICPADPSEHFLIGLTDTVAFALAIDALNHDGPTAVARVAEKGCAQDGIPDLDPTGLARAAVTYGTGEGAEEVPVEPALRCYVTGTCATGQRRARLRVAVAPRRPVAGRMTRLRFRVRARVNGRTRAVRRAVVRLGARRARTGRLGRATLRLRFRSGGRRRVTASAPGYARGRTTIRVRRIRR